MPLPNFVQNLEPVRSFAVIHSPSFHSAMRYQSGTLYFAERGTSHLLRHQTLSHLTMGASEQKLVAQFRMFKVEIPAEHRGQMMDKKRLSVLVVGGLAILDHTQPESCTEGVTMRSSTIICARDINILRKALN